MFSAISIYWDWAFSAIPIYWDWADYFDLLGLGGFRLFRSIGIGPTIPIYWDWAGYSDLLGLGVPKETIRGDYSKEWHLVPELWYLNYDT